MLRTLVPSEPELVRLCKAKSWPCVTVRAQSHPEEAAPSPSALRGEGTTVLAIAVRSRAPLDVIQALVKARVYQIDVCNDRRGTILHEALYHRTSQEVLRYLLEAVIHFEHVHNHMGLRGPSLLGRRDVLGRTALHYMVERSMQDEAQDDLTTTWVLFRSLVLAHPQAIQMMDSDGNTPLVELLLNTHVDNNTELEAQLFRMVQLLVATCPAVATIARKLDQPWRYPHNEECLNHDKCSAMGDGAPSPLSCALLRGRSLDIIQLLLKANKKFGVKACLAIISKHHEMPLHVAVSMRASPLVLSKLIENGRDAIGISDVHGLTPLDWLWVRFVVDCCSTPRPLDNVMVSKRRYIPSQYVEWHQHVTEALEEPPAELGTILRQQLWERLCELLPAAAAATSNCTEEEEPWSILHAASFVMCPLALVRLSLEYSAPETVQTRDKRQGRLPLHYAVARLGYHVQVPVGIQRRLRHVSEPRSLVPELLLSKFLKAAHVADAQVQLPLHIAIETVGKQQTHCSEADREEAESVVMTILSHYHDALERRDGKTKLYPFLQAAVGQGASASIIYSLLREHPTLVTSAIPSHDRE